MKNQLKFLANIFKEGFVIFVYIIIMGVIAIIAAVIKSLALRAAAYIATVLFFIFFVVIFAKNSGEKQYKNLLTGNIRRSKGVGEEIDKYCKPYEEYRVYKGFLIGTSVFLPMYLLILLNLIIKSGGIQIALKLIYAISYMPLIIFKENISIYFMVLLSVLYIAAAGFGYFLGAKKIMLQQEKLQKTHDLIYGKDKK